jgi:hypothetical protein
MRRTITDPLTTITVIVIAALLLLTGFAFALSNPPQFHPQTLPADTEPPVTVCILNGTMNGTAYITSVTVSLLATDNDSGVNYTMVQIDAVPYSLYNNPFVVSEIGNHSVWYYSVDNVGNQEMEKNVSFQINQSFVDTEPPFTSCFLSGTMNGTYYTSNVSVILTGADNESGVNYTMFKIDNDSYALYLTPFLVSGNGIHTVWFYSVDLAGNQEQEKNVSFTIIPPPDIQPPVTVCQLNGSMNGTTYTSSVTVTLSATDNDTGVNYTLYRIDNGTYTTYAEPFIVSGNGLHTVWFYSVDYAGNQELEKNVSFTILATIQLSLKVILGLGVHVFITNSGTMDAVNVPWNISLNGGHIFFGKTENGTVNVPAGNEVLVRDFVIGFGQPSVTIKVGTITKTVNVMVLLFWLFTVG